jgi:ASC-1-like (ASCH) protein
MYVSYCPELDVASCGEDVEQAKKNLVESIIINIEETKKLGTFEQFLEDNGLEENMPDVLSARKELVGFMPIELHV